jgi:hypothetical protein
MAYHPLYVLVDTIRTRYSSRGRTCPRSSARIQQMTVRILQGRFTPVARGQITLVYEYVDQHAEIDAPFLACNWLRVDNKGKPFSGDAVL